MHALATHPQLKLVKSMELTPHRHGTDGFYAAVIAASV
jgi:16S rRNA C967 or C1407 C5-methylase (RsmB/RsmF family)